VYKRQPMCIALVVLPVRVLMVMPSHCVVLRTGPISTILSSYSVSPCLLILTMTIIVTKPIVPSSLPQRPLAEAVVVEAVQGSDVAAGDRDAQQHRLTLRVLGQVGKDDSVELSERDHDHALARPDCTHLPAWSDIVFWAETLGSAASPHAFIRVIIECPGLPETCLHRCQLWPVLRI